MEGWGVGGEGGGERLKPNERRLLSYAVDLGVQVNARAGDQQEQHITRIRIVRGVGVQHSEQRSKRVYTVRNNDDTPRTVVIEHPIRPGSTLGADLTPP